MSQPIVPSITDEEIGEMEREARVHCEGPWPEDALRLIARLRAAEVDSARYRWLRDVSRHGSLGWLEFKITRQEWDVQIDAAMEKNP